MPVPTYGAAPLSKTWIIVRVLQLICFICIVGITANFVSEIVSSNQIVPKEIIGTLVVTCIATLYCLITIPFFYAGANLGLLIMTAFDFLLMIAFIVVAVVLGKPVSYLSCNLIGDASAAQNTASALTFTESIGSNVGNFNGNYYVWVDATKADCYETKAAWGMSIALCVLFACSFLILPALFAKQKRAQKQAEKGAA